MKKLHKSIFIFLIFSSFSSCFHAMEEQQEPTTKVHNLCLFIDVLNDEGLQKPLNSVAGDCAITLSRETSPTFVCDAKIFDIIVAMSEDFIEEYCHKQDPASCKLLLLIKNIKQQIKSIEKNNCKKAKKNILKLQKKISKQLFKYLKNQYTDNLLCYLCLTNFEEQNLLYKISLQTKKLRQIGYLMIPIQYLDKFNLTKDSPQEQILKKLRFNTEHPELIVEKTSLNEVKQKTSTLHTFKPKLNRFKPNIIKNLLLPGDQLNTWHIYWTGHGSKEKEIGGVSYNDACKITKILENKYTALLHINSCYFGNELASKVLSSLKEQRELSKKTTPPMLISTHAVADISTYDNHTHWYTKINLEVLLNEYLQNNNTKIKEQILDPIYPYIYTPNMKKFLNSLETISNDLNTIEAYHFGGIQASVLPKECILVFQPAYTHLLQHKIFINETILTNIPQLFIPEKANKNTTIHIQPGIIKVTAEKKDDTIVDNKNLIIIDCHIIGQAVKFKNIDVNFNEPYCRCFFRHIQIPYYIFKEIKVNDLSIQEFIHNILFHREDADYLEPVTVLVRLFITKNTHNGKKKHFKNIFVKCYEESNTLALAEHRSLAIQIQDKHALTTYKKGKKDIRNKITKALNNALKYGVCVDNNFFNFMKQ